MNWIKRIIQVKFNEFVLKKDQSPVANVVNWGRSDRLNQFNQTCHIQWSCFIEWILSGNKCG